VLFGAVALHEVADRLADGKLLARQGAVEL
jgi:hypothetical protein